MTPSDHFFYHGVLLALLLCGCATHKVDAWHRNPPKPEWKVWPSNGASYLTCPEGWLLVNSDHCESVAPTLPKGGACGEPITFQFEDGHKETWLYKCWPESSVPECLKGCTKQPEWDIFLRW